MARPKGSLGRSEIPLDNAHTGSVPSKTGGNPDQVGGSLKILAGRHSSQCSPWPSRWDLWTGRMGPLTHKRGFSEGQRGPWSDQSAHTLKRSQVYLRSQEGIKIKYREILPVCDSFRSDKGFHRLAKDFKIPENTPSNRLEALSDLCKRSGPFLAPGPFDVQCAPSETFSWIRP